MIPGLANISRKTVVILFIAVMTVSLSVRQAEPVALRSTGYPLTTCQQDLAVTTSGGILIFKVCFGIYE